MLIDKVRCEGEPFDNWKRLKDFYYDELQPEEDNMQWIYRGQPDLYYKKDKKYKLTTILERTIEQFGLSLSSDARPFEKKVLHEFQRQLQGEWGSGHGINLI